jgi:hypothetical protein
MNKFDTLYSQILKEQKRIQSIAVKDKNGKTVKFYAPNHIGNKEQTLKDKAQKEADEIGGTVQITYFK